MRITILSLFVVSLLLVGAGCTQNTNTNHITDTVNNAVRNAADQVVQEAIEYGTDMSAEAVANAKADCEQKGGDLNTCGSLCDEGETCATVCALVCEFE